MIAWLTISVAAFGQTYPKYTDVHDFGPTIVYVNGTSGPDGIGPYTGVTFDSAGNMYGTTIGGGNTFGAAYGGGIVWEITTSGVYKDLHDFGGTVLNANGVHGPDGNSPYSGVTIDSKGNLFGTTYQGGRYDVGMVWEITAAGSYLDLHDFGGSIINANDTYGPDGTFPMGGVTVDKAGNLFGTTTMGGPIKGSSGTTSYCGMVWEITAAGSYLDLHDFGGPIKYSNGAVGPDGANSASTVTLDSAGNMYGTATLGGPNPAASYHAGLVWEITVSGTYLDLHDFGEKIINANGGVGSDGAFPGGAITIDSAMNLYGTASVGGANDSGFRFGGMVWEITASGGYKDLHDFGGTVVYPNGSTGPDGVLPELGVTFDQVGNMFGTTFYGGANGEGNEGFGTIWEITAAGGYRDLHDFGGSAKNLSGTVGADGHFPISGVTLSSTGVLYGTTEDGGQFSPYPGVGMVWSLALAPSISVKTLSVAPASILGGASSTGTLTLTAAAPTGGGVVSLSSNVASAKVPASVTVAAGATTASFTITTTGVDAQTLATITAGSGNGAQTATLTIAPAVVSSLTISPTTVAGGEDSTGTVTLSGPSGPEGTWVEITDNSDYEACPANVLVPAGTTSATFNITTSIVDDRTTATITVTHDGVSKSADLTITPPTLVEVSVDPADVEGRIPTTGTVTLTGEAGTKGLVVSLSSDNSAVTVPKSVTVEPGQSEATFNVTTTTVAEQLEVTITATSGSVTKTTTLTVTPPTLIAFSLNPTTVSGGASSTGTVALSGPAPASGISVKLSSDLHLATVPATVKVKPGLRLATFTVKTVTVGAQYTANISASLEDATLSNALKISPPDLVSVTIKPTSLIGGATATGAITLNGPAPAGGMPVTLSISPYGSVPATVTVPVNKTSATFTIKTPAVATDTTSTVTAEIGTSSKSATLTISAPKLKSLTLSPTTVVHGKASVGTVTLTSAAPSNGLAVALSSSRTEVTVPASVTIAAGKTSATFSVKTNSVKSKTSATISASAGGVTKTAMLTIS